MKKLTIGHLYPDLLNLYGDRGNIQCFRKRLEWRGMEAEVIPFLSGEKIDFSKLDIVLLGGGSDREQELVCGFLKDIKDDFKAYVEDGGVVLAVCGGYQLLGKYYKTNKKTIEGLSILDITTEWQPERLTCVFYEITYHVLAAAGRLSLSAPPVLLRSGISNPQPFLTERSMRHDNHSSVCDTI